MDYKQYVKKYSGVEIDFDGMYGAQCVDLFRHALSTIHNIPRNLQPSTAPSGGAKDLINNVKPPLRVLDKDELPKPGDFAIFGPTSSNKFGHVAMLLEANGTDLTVFEQIGLNDAQGSRGDGRGAHKAVRSTVNLSGYITFRKRSGI